MESKLDERDGRYKLLDVNLRTWGSHTIGWPAGVDLAGDQRGQPIEPVRARAGVKRILLRLSALPRLNARYRRFEPPS